MEEENKDEKTVREWADLMNAGESGVAPIGLESGERKRIKPTGKNVDDMTEDELRSFMNSEEYENNGVIDLHLKN
jgi:hypothetical protein